MNILHSPLVGFLFSVTGHASEITIDLSADRRLDRVLQSGADVRHEPIMESYSIVNSDIHWIFPRGIEFRHHCDLGSVKAEKNVIMYGNSISHRGMPLKDAYGIMVKFISRLKPLELQTQDRKKLDEWYAVESNKQAGDYLPEFGRFIRFKDSGFRVGVSIRESFHPIYPAILTIAFSWSEPKKSDRAEAPIEPSTEILDLNTLEGKTYDQRDGLNDAHLEPDPAFGPWLRGEGPMPDVEKFKAEKIKAAALEADKLKTANTGRASDQKPNYFLHLIWIPLAALVWWLYRKYRTVAKG